MSENTEIDVEEEIEELESDEELHEEAARTSDDYEKEIKKLRKEAASRRMANKELDAELAEFKKWKDSQRTELEREKAKSEELALEIAKLKKEKLMVDIAEEFDLDPELIDFIDGADEKEMRRKAEKLAEKGLLKAAKDSDSLRAGAGRGTPVNSKKGSLGGNFLVDTAKRDGVW